MLSVSIDSLQIHSSTSAINYWLQTPIEGLDAPDVRMSLYDKPGEDGGVVASEFYSSRVITLPGIVRGATPAIFEANRQALATACAILKDSNGAPLPHRLTFTTLAGNQYFIDGYFKRPIFNYENINWSKFLLQFVSPMPYLFGVGINTSSSIAVPSGGGFILPVILPITSTATMGGSAVVTNNGNAPSYPNIILTGPLTNPLINNTTIGKTIQLNYTIPSGSVVTINMQEKLILLNGASGLESTKTSASDWWPMMPGANNITFSTDNSGDTGNLAFSFYNAYLGA